MYKTKKNQTNLSYDDFDHNDAHNQRKPYLRLVDSQDDFLDNQNIIDINQPYNNPVPFRSTMQNPPFYGQNFSRSQSRQERYREEYGRSYGSDKFNNRNRLVVYERNHPPLNTPINKPTHKQSYYQKSYFSQNGNNNRGLETSLVPNTYTKHLPVYNKHIYGRVTFWGDLINKIQNNLLKKDLNVAMNKLSFFVLAIGTLVFSALLVFIGFLIAVNVYDLGSEVRVGRQTYEDAYMPPSIHMQTFNPNNPYGATGDPYVGRAESYPAQPNAQLRMPSQNLETSYNQPTFPLNGQNQFQSTPQYAANPSSVASIPPQVTPQIAHQQQTIPSQAINPHTSVQVGYPQVSQPPTNQHQVMYAQPAQQQVYSQQQQNIPPHQIPVQGHAQGQVQGPAQGFVSGSAPSAIPSTGQFYTQPHQ